jgi:CTP:phosphocholine cytidylyltransferase-like protein
MDQYEQKYKISNIYIFNNNNIKQKNNNFFVESTCNSCNQLIQTDYIKRPVNIKITETVLKEHKAEAIVVFFGWVFIRSNKVKVK